MSERFPTGPDDVVPAGRDPLKWFKLGLLLIVASWGVKQLFVSFATYSLGGALLEVNLELDEEAARQERTYDQRKLLAEEEGKDDPDLQKVQDAQDQMDKIRAEVSKEYDALELDAEVNSANGASQSLTFTRWFLRIKLFMDLFKIVGVSLMVWGAVGIASDERHPEHLRWFATLSAVVALMGVLIWGFLSFLS
ncbi:MAG: hypothetical protein AUK47_11070 [Deltaproteobacteria bacterium CG2_30_63_29]|nr:MAG: hypothetical protein AUK47_11070 [Deltaproteobacteria bacterium CG2_30_63_29]PJB36546.1 MAG: hypothetical protein CO108_23070 [Deltaproteobacteria bacterium CG_4_9_14_3_um_filter_63_12]